MNFGSLYFLLVFFLVLGVLVFFHELGHFLAAKMLKMRVLEFAFNVGPKLLRLYHDGETEYTIRAIPLGGFVRIAGMEIEDEVESRLTGASRPSDADSMTSTNIALEQQEAEGVSTADPNGFNSRPVWQRFIVILAGPVFSVLLGWLILISIGALVGMPDKSTIAVRGLVAGGAAESAGLRKGDTLLAIDGKTINTGMAALDTIRTSVGKPLAISVRGEDKAERVVTVTPAPKKDDPKVGQIGIELKSVILSMKKQDWPTSIREGNENVGKWFSIVAGKFYTGEIKNDVGGPIRIFTETKEATEIGGPYLLGMVGQLSLSLGVFNLFPIPILDGGHLVLLTLEAVRRRKLTPMQTMRVQYTGLAILAAIFVLVMFKDVTGLLKRG